MRLQIYCSSYFTCNIIAPVFKDYSSVALQLVVSRVVYSCVWVCYAFIAGVFYIFKCGPLRREKFGEVP